MFYPLSPGTLTNTSDKGPWFQESLGRSVEQMTGLLSHLLPSLCSRQTGQAVAKEHSTAGWSVLSHKVVSLTPHKEWEQKHEIPFSICLFLYVTKFFV